MLEGDFALDQLIFAFGFYFVPEALVLDRGEVTCGEHTYKKCPNLARLPWPGGEVGSASAGGGSNVPSAFMVADNSLEGRRPWSIKKD